MHGMTLPPHTGTNSPVIKPVKSEAKKATTLAVSWSVPRRLASVAGACQVYKGQPVAYGWVVGLGTNTWSPRMST